MPADMAPSPMTQTTLLARPLRSRATAMPRPADIEARGWAGLAIVSRRGVGVTPMGFAIVMIAIFPASTHSGRERRQRTVAEKQLERSSDSKQVQAPRS